MLILLLLFLLIGLYLNRSYAYFFNYLGSHSISPPNQQAQFDPNQQFIYPNKSDPNWNSYVALGDSLTFGVGVSDPAQTFPADFGELLYQKQSFHYYNLGIPGAKTDQLINIELPKMEKLDPKIITLLIGINDVLDMQPADKFQKNYQLILDQITKNSQTKVIILNIPDLVNNKVMLPPYNYLVDLRIRQFNSIIALLISEKQKSFTNLKFVDLYDQTKQQFSQNSGLYSIDNFHPNSQGYKLWSQVIDASYNH